MSSPRGVIVIDKPSGMTSFDVVARVRKIFGERRVGHTGTLDPMATGVLPICVGEACKLVPYLTADDKAYDATICFGAATDTYDADGQVTATADARAVTAAAIAAVLPRFLGDIEQKPPAFSAIKVDGKRAYDLARDGQAPEMKMRAVTLHRIDLGRVRHEGERAFADIHVECGKGTYIRSLAFDIGAALALPAHLTALRRTRSGAFSLTDAVPLADATPTHARSLEAAVATIPSFILDDTEALAVRDGKQYALPAIVTRHAIPLDSAPVVLLRPDKTLLALAAPKADTKTLELLRVFV